MTYKLFIIGFFVLFAEMLVNAEALPQDLKEVDLPTIVRMYTNARAERPDVDYMLQGKNAALYAGRCFYKGSLSQVAGNGALFIAKHRNELKFLRAGAEVDEDGTVMPADFYDDIKLNGDSSYDDFEVLDLVRPLTVRQDSIVSELSDLNIELGLKRYGSYYLVLGRAIRDDIKLGDMAGETVSACVFFKRAEEPTFFELLADEYDFGPTVATISFDDLKTEDMSGFLVGRCYDSFAHSQEATALNGAAGAVEIKDQKKFAISFRSEESMNYFDEKYFGFNELVSLNWLEDATALVQRDSFLSSNAPGRAYAIKRFVDERGNESFIGRISSIGGEQSSRSSELLCDLWKSRPPSVPADPLAAPRWKKRISYRGGICCCGARSRRRD